MAAHDHLKRLGPKVWGNGITDQKLGWIGHRGGAFVRLRQHPFGQVDPSDDMADFGSDERKKTRASAHVQHGGRRRWQQAAHGGDPRRLFRHLHVRPVAGLTVITGTAPVPIGVDLILDQGRRCACHNTPV